MGCDIHLGIEVRRNGLWEWYEQEREKVEWGNYMRSIYDCGRIFFDN